MGGIHELRRSGFINIGSVARGQPHVQTVRWSHRPTFIFFKIRKNRLLWNIAVEWSVHPRIRKVGRKKTSCQGASWLDRIRY
jgi:hypothetical protein